MLGMRNDWRKDRPVLVAVGLSHKNAKLPERAQLASSGGALDAALAGYAGLDGIDEVAVLSTASGLEVFATSPCPAAAIPALRRSLEARAGRDLPLRELRGEAAFEHLVRIACGLDSATVFEPQILRRVNDAFQRALELGTAGDELTDVLGRALDAAHRVRAETALGRSDLPWAHAAGELAEKVLGSLVGRAVAVLGSGELARISARHLAGRGASIVVLDRALPDAEALAREVGGAAGPVEALVEELRRVDVVVSAAPAAPDALRPEAVAATMRSRRRRLVLVDLADPCAIPLATGRVEDVYLCDLADLVRVMRSPLDERAQARADAERIVGEEVARWARREAERRAAPLLHEIRSRASAIARQEVERTLRRLGHDPELVNRLDAMAGSIVEQLLRALLGRAVHDEALVAAAERMFDVRGPGRARISTRT